MIDSDSKLKEIVESSASDDLLLEGEEFLEELGERRSELFLSC